MKKLTSAALVILCLLILTWALLRANASWHFFAAQSIAEPLFEDGYGDAIVFRQSESHINTALQRFPNNPDYLDFAGRLMLLEARQTGVVGREHRLLLESAANNFRQAISVRPLWPYSWANLLAAKDNQGQVDLEFNEAMKQSARLGPWEPRVQLQIIRSGLRHWGELGSNKRELVERKVLDALKIQPQKVFVTIKYFGRPDLVCDIEDTHVKIKRWCKNLL